MARLGVAQTAAIVKTARTVARRAWRSMCYPLRVAIQDPRTRTNPCLAAPVRSVQLKIKGNNGNYLDRLGVDPHRLPAPILHRSDCGVCERRFTFQQFLELDSAIFKNAQLQLDTPLHACLLREGRIRRSWAVNEPFAKVRWVFSEPSANGDFQRVDPAF